MRFLFTFAGGNGHFQPLIPIVLAARHAGHMVAVAGQPGMIPVIEAAGFEAIPISGATLRTAPDRLPVLKLDLEREDRALRLGFATRLARQHANAVLTLCEDWQPDLLVCDEIDFGAMLAAERFGIPYAIVSVNASGSFIRKEVVAEPLWRLHSELGLPPDPELTMLSRYLVLSPFPPTFRHPAFPLPATAHAFRLHELPNGSSEKPAWAFADDLPLIYFTLGTIFNIESGDLFERVLAGLGDLPVNVIATVGRELDPTDLGLQPANIRVERYIPQEMILPYCTLAVSHGGSGSVTGALTHGVPMVLLPMGADQPYNAWRCEALGLAQVLDVLDATPEMVRSTVKEMLANPLYRNNAYPLRQEIANLPGPDSALGLLEKLAAEGQPLISR